MRGHCNISVINLNNSNIPQLSNIYIIIALAKIQDVSNKQLVVFTHKSVTMANLYAEKQPEVLFFTARRHHYLYDHVRRFQQ